MINFRQYNNVTKIVIPDKIQLSDNDFSNAFNNMRNLTIVSIPNNVVNLSNTYKDCIRLTGSPVCGNNVTDMSSAYSGCNNLTGSPACGNNVTNMFIAYHNCPNLYGNGYFYSNNVADIQNCFYGRNTSNYLNLYVPANSTTLNTCLYNNTSSMVGTSIDWTDDIATNGRYYNTQYNIYIYPVENVAAARAANGD